MKVLKPKLVLFSGHKEIKIHTTNLSQSMSHLHILRRWTSNVVPMDRAERIHGHVMGLWQNFGHALCDY